jgi:hypothetical protein
MAENISAAPSTVPELTVRSLIVGIVVAMIIGAAYPYCLLKLGFGPDLSVVPAFFGFIALVLFSARRAHTRAKTTSCKRWAPARSESGAKRLAVTFFGERGLYN